MSNRCINIIEQIEREAEHCKRLARMEQSHDIYPAAVCEANEHKLALSYAAGRYQLTDQRHSIFFYPCRQVVMRSIVGARRLERIDLTAECDVLDVVLLFVEGKFLK